MTVPPAEHEKAKREMMQDVEDQERIKRQEMAVLRGSSGPGPRLLSEGQRLLQSFLLSHPHLPVYRLAIRPGEAYIAPIEVMPHDSSTYGMRANDISLSAVGHFDPLAGG